MNIHKLNINSDLKWSPKLNCFYEYTIKMECEADGEPFYNSISAKLLESALLK